MTQPPHDPNQPYGQYPQQPFGRQPGQFGHWPSPSPSPEGDTGEFNQGGGTNWDQIGDISDDTGTDV